MNPPIIVGGDDVSVFPSAEQAEQYLEAIDVRNDEYVGYDSEGRKLTFGIRKVEKRGFVNLSYELVEITCSEEEPLHADELREVLDDYVLRVAELRKIAGEKDAAKEWLCNLSLAELLEKLCQGMSNKSGWSVHVPEFLK